jgi:two-component system sensor histidine kinase KdpD
VADSSFDVVSKVDRQEVDNALNQAGKEIGQRFDFKNTGDRVEVAVVDHGPGVAADQRERMFEPFQRLGDNDITTGVGLGLAVARGFVDAIGGRLWAAETPGGGLTMTVSLPTVPAHARPAREPLL